MSKSSILFISLIAAILPVQGQEKNPLPGTSPLTATGDLSSNMVAGIDSFLMKEIGRSKQERQKYWHLDFSSPESFQKSVQTNRDHFRTYTGAVDNRIPKPLLELKSTPHQPALV